MGVGWLMQNAFYFRGEAFLGQRGNEPIRCVPPIVTAPGWGIPIGGGTDAHRVMGPNPFVCLQWMLDSKTLGGAVMRGPEEIPSRLEALRIYTEGSAWFAFDEGNRGSLAAGKLADLVGAGPGLSHGAGGGDRRHRRAAHHGRRAGVVYAAGRSNPTRTGRRSAEIGLRRRFKNIPREMALRA